ncbi:F0F1 ATP synthase subunit epsilon [Candidatus Uhrbacteria bacterium]|nr:F0F1 ATP synthase subunit epsilon [Candidatus Uhrbacteria bacterium]
MAKLQFEITTPERIVYRDEVDQITIPTKEGEITVLPNHIPLVSLLSPGALTIKKNKEEVYMATSGGFIEVQPGNKVIVLADTAERSEELDIAAIEAAKERARKVLRETRNVDDVRFADAAAGLERELARLKVARKHRGGKVFKSPNE